MQLRVHGMNEALRMPRAPAVEIPHDVGITTEVTIVTGDATSSTHAPVAGRFHDDDGIPRTGDVEEFRLAVLLGTGIRTRDYIWTDT